MSVGIGHARSLAESEFYVLGVQGIHGLELSNGVLSSQGKNVKLGNGVRMIVRVDILP